MRLLSIEEFAQVSGGHDRDIDPPGTTEDHGFGVVTREGRSGPNHHFHFDFSNAPPPGGWTAPFFGFNTGGTRPFYGVHT